MATPNKHEENYSGSRKNKGYSVRSETEHPLSAVKQIGLYGDPVRKRTSHKFPRQNLSPSTLGSLGWSSPRYDSKCLLAGSHRNPPFVLLLHAMRRRVLMRMFQDWHRLCVLFSRLEGWPPSACGLFCSIPRSTATMESVGSEAAAI